MPDKKIGDNFFIFRVELDLFQSLHKENILFVLLISKNKQKIIIDALGDLELEELVAKTEVILLKMVW